jgi:hypothetical protein
MLDTLFLLAVLAIIAWNIPHPYWTDWIAEQVKAQIKRLRRK